MDTHPDDVNEVARRLVACRPATDGLDADAMLFAAGRASARPGPARFVWPALTAGLGVLAVVLGAWLAAERSERLALTERLRQPTTVPAPLTPSAPPAPVEPPTADRPAPNSVLASYKALEQGLDAWPPMSVPGANPPGPRPSEPPVLRVGRPATLPDL